MNKYQKRSINTIFLAAKAQKLKKNIANVIGDTRQSNWYPRIVNDSTQCILTYFELTNQGINPITAIQGLFGTCFPNLFSLPPTRHGLRGHPYKQLQGASHRRRRG